MLQSSSGLSRKAVSSAKWTSISAVHSVATQTIKIVVLGRLLAPEAFGLMAVAYLVIEYAMVFVRGGLTEAIIYRQEANKDQLSSLYWINVFFGLFLTMVVMLTSGPLSRLIGNTQVEPILNVIGVGLIVSALSVQFLTMFRKNLVFKLISIIEIVHKSIDVIVAVVLALFGFGVWALVWGFVVGTSAKTALLFASAWRNHMLPSFHFSFSEIKGFLAFGAYRIGTDLLNRLYTRADQMIVAATFNATTLGYYHMASRLIFLPVQQINPIVTKVSFPALARVQNEPERLRRGYFKIVRLLQFIVIPTLTVFAFTAHLVVPFVLGNQWRPIVPLIRIMAFYGVLRSTMNAAGSLNMAKGKANWTFYFNIILSVVVLGAMGLSSAIFGTVEALATTVTVTYTFLWFFHYRFFIYRLVGPSAREYFGSAFLTLGCGIVAGAIGSLMAEFVGPTLIAQTLIAVTVAIVSYLLLSMVLQRQLLREAIALLR